jgi:hypothetical protein
MRVNFGKEPKRTAIVSLSVSLCYNTKKYDLKSQDLFYLREYLLKICNRKEVDFVTKKGKNVFEPYIKSFYDVDLNDYDEVIIHNSFYNMFFGGVIGEIYEQTLWMLSRYTGDIWYCLIDTRFGFTDYGKYVKDRLLSKTPIKSILNKLTPDDCQRFSENITPRIKCLFDGMDYDKLKAVINGEENKKRVKNHWKFEILEDWDAIEMTEFWAANLIDLPKTELTKKEFDIIYYGTNRRTERMKIMDSMFKEYHWDQEDPYMTSLNKRWIGYDPEYPDTTVSDFLDRKELSEEINKSWASLVMGDIHHYGNVRTLRFFESLASNSLALIHAPYEGNCLLITKQLRELITFNTYDDITNILYQFKGGWKNQYLEVLELQKREFKIITGKYKQKEPIKLNKIKSLF